VQNDVVPAETTVKTHLGQLIAAGMPKAVGTPQRVGVRLLGRLKAGGAFYLTAIRV
jgi:hypothetical protein